MNKDNIYRRARKKAAETNFLLNDSKNSQEFLGIDKAKLLAIENGKKSPHPDDVATMATVYDAPELCNFYCACECSIGKQQPVKRYEYDNLSEISVKLIVSLNELEQIESRIYKILADGKISESEREEFDGIVDVLGKIAFSAESLKLWAKKHGFEKKEKK